MLGLRHFMALSTSSSETLVRVRLSYGREADGRVLAASLVKDYRITTTILEDA
jgi:hypothetical protein